MNRPSHLLQLLDQLLLVVYEVITELLLVGQDVLQLLRGHSLRGC